MGSNECLSPSYAIHVEELIRSVDFERFIGLALRNVTPTFLEMI